MCIFCLSTINSEIRTIVGPIFSLKLAGQPVVVLNTHKVTADLLGKCISHYLSRMLITDLNPLEFSDRRSNIYSDRPRYIMAGEILTGGIFVAFAGYGELYVCPWKLTITAS